ncbi:hypothetical protein BZA77DRAFT_352633 [Pyronema omphalodes]|nr:hypothetical protein BZA77DRAFT_352633 [Pyronema omphalodes]
MSTTSTLTTNPQISSPAYESTLRSFYDLGSEISRLEIENKRLMDYNTAIEKELLSLHEHNTSIEKELQALNELNSVLEKESATLKEENDKLSWARDDAVKKCAQVEEEKANLQRELDGFAELREVRGLKRKCEELENRTTGNQERIEKLFEDYQQETKKQIAEIQNQSHKNFQQEIEKIKADYSREMQSVMSVMKFGGPGDWKIGHIVREEPFNIIPAGMIQVSLAKAVNGKDISSDGPPCEDENTRFLYVVRDRYKDFKTFTELVALIFGLRTDRIKYLAGTKSGLLYYGKDKLKVIQKWEKEASQNDRVYILSHDKGNHVWNSGPNVWNTGPDVWHTVYYVQC